MECQCVVKFGADMELMQRPDLEAAGDEIVLRITACGVCHSDVHMKAGGYDVGTARSSTAAGRCPASSATRSQAR